MGKLKSSIFARLILSRPDNMLKREEQQLSSQP